MKKILKLFKLILFLIITGDRKMLEPGLYLLCPKCHKFSKGEGWEACYSEYSVYSVEVVGDDVEYDHV